MSVVSLIDVSKSYAKGDKKVQVLQHLNFTIEQGEMMAVIGKSGAGKTTLLNLIAGIDYPDSGEYRFLDQSVQLRKSSDGVRFRRNRIGIIVQHFALVQDMSVFENVEMGLWESGFSFKKQREKTLDTLKLLGIDSLMRKYPVELSGGEKQRVAIARAVVAEPQLILADEPTGALDSETERSIMDILSNLHRTGTTMMIITHDQDIARQCSAVFELKKH